MSETISGASPASSSLKLECHMFFICPECGLELENQLDWRYHLNKVHDYSNKKPEDFNYKVVDNKYYECLVCHKWLTNAIHVPTLLQYHRFNHLPYPKTYRCRHCPSAYSRKRVLSQHLLRSHPAVVGQNDKVHIRKHNPNVTTAQTFKDPKMNKEFYMRFLCPLCGKLFARFNQWQQHIDGSHTSTSVDLKVNRIACSRDYYCTECSHVLSDGPTRDQLRRHHFSHLPYQNYFQCAFCYIRKTSKTELFLHYVKHHTADYLKNSDYVLLPEEWGGPADESILDEIKRILEGQAAASEPKADIIQKALRESFINFEDVATDNQSHVQFNHEQALDQSLNGFENVVVIQVPPSNADTTERSPLKYSDIGDDDLELICNEMFEEVHEGYQSEESEEQTPSTHRPLSADRLQNEMQKYIHYLCPECGREFINQAKWRAHVFEEHNLANAVDTKFRPMNALKTSFLCLVCYQVQRTTKSSDLRRHHFQHMPYQSYLKCTICTKTKSSKPKMLQHLEYVHVAHIQRDVMAALNRAKTPAAAKKLHCLECDKTYTVPSRFKNHCRICPKRLEPIAVGQYDIAKNMKLLEHLQKASIRLDQMLEEAGIDASSIKLPYK